MKRSFCILAIVLMAATAAPMTTAQESWPNKPIHVLVGSPTGGIPDVIVRILAEPMVKALQQPLIVEGKPGAGGNLAAAAAASAKPDGYTFMLTTVGSHGIGPSLFKKQPFDAVRDFTGVARVVEFPTVLLVSTKLGARTLKEVIAYAKANPGKLNYGSTGPGTLSHLAGVLLAANAGIDIVHIPQRSYAAGQQGLMTGDLHLLFMHVTASKDAVPIAVTGTQRYSGLPDVPTFTESGVRGLDEVTQWMGYVAPSGTPKPIVERFAGEVAKALKDPEVVTRLRNMTAVPAMLPPAEFEAFYKSEIARWAPIVKASGASAN